MGESTLPPLVAIVGPTGVGKTEIAIDIALALDGEIVSADSRQVYRYMDIGTAKPTEAEQARVRHHLIDFLLPDEALTLGVFQRMAYDTIAEITARRKLPLLVGGTGQYVRAAAEGWGIPEVRPHRRLRADLEGFGEVYGATSLHAWLRLLDAGAAETIDFRNARRVIRALEVCLISGQPITALQERTPPPYRVLQIGLTRPRELLYDRVDRRIGAMMDGGFVEEVRRLLAMGYGRELPSMSSLGYVQIMDALEGKKSLEEAVTEVKRDTRRFIRHQYNWFHPDDERIQWFDLEQATSDDVLAAIRDWLQAAD